MAFIVLSLSSFVFKENPLYHIAESIYVGAAAGHMIVMGYKNVSSLAFYPLFSQGKLSMLVPLLLALTLAGRFTKKYYHLSRYAIALPLGMGTGIALRGIPSAQILSQVKATFLSLSSIDNIIVIIGVTSTICFFLFTTIQNRYIKAYANLGRRFIIVSLGLTFATAVFTEVALYLGVVQLIFGDWLGIIQ